MESASVSAISLRHILASPGHPLDNRGKCHMDEKRIQCLSMCQQPLCWNGLLQTLAVGWGNRLKLNTDKTELLWVGPGYSLHQHNVCLPELYLGHDSVVARDHVHLLGATISSDLSLDRQVSIVSASSFYWLRQLRRSLDTQSAATLVHSFVSLRVDYCNTVLAGAPKVTTDKLPDFKVIHSLTLNISKMAGDTAIVTMEGE